MRAAQASPPSFAMRHAARGSPARCAAPWTSQTPPPAAVERGAASGGSSGGGRGTVRPRPWASGELGTPLGHADPKRFRISVPQVSGRQYRWIHVVQRSRDPAMGPGAPSLPDTLMPGHELANSSKPPDAASQSQPGDPREPHLRACGPDVSHPSPAACRMPGGALDARSRPARPPSAVRRPTGPGCRRPEAGQRQWRHGRCRGVAAAGRAPASPHRRAVPAAAGQRHRLAAARRPRSHRRAGQPGLLRSTPQRSAACTPAATAAGIHTARLNGAWLRAARPPLLRTPPS